MLKLIKRLSWPIFALAISSCAANGVVVCPVPQEAPKALMVKPEYEKRVRRVLFESETTQTTKSPASKKPSESAKDDK